MGIGSANPLLLAASGGDTDPVTRSLRLDGGESLSRTFSSTGDSKKFTFACWVKRTELGGNQRIFQASNSNNDDFLRFNNDNTLGYWIYQNGSHNHQGNTTAVFRDVSAWMHVCYVVDTAQATAANRVKIFVNGVSHTLSVYPDQNRDCSVMNTAALHYIGRYGNSASEYANLYIADAYFLDGEAVEPIDNFIESNDYGGYKPKEYTGSFGTNGFHIDAQPAHDADLLVSSIDRNDGDTTFADSAAGHTITDTGDPEHSINVGNPFTGDDRAVYFDGSSDYLTSTDAKDDANFDNSDWTLEFWINPSNTFGSAIESFMGCGGGYAGWNSSNGHSWTIFAYNVTNQIYFQWWTGSSHVNMAANDDLLPKNTWTHVAVCNQSGTKRFYIGGVQVDTDSTNAKAAVSAPSTFNIGVSSALDGKLNGHLYDVSIQRGYCKYEDGTTFTPPTSKIEADSNTEFLLQPEKDDSSFEDESSNGHTVSTQGSPTTIASTPYEAAAKSTAMYFDGSGDYLTVPTHADLKPESGDFTVEAWINYSSIPDSSYGSVIYGVCGGAGGPSGDSLAFMLKPDGHLGLIYGDTHYTGSSATAMSSDTWYHVALVRSSGTVKLYIDGDEDYSATHSGNLNNTTDNRIGARGGTAMYFDGYMYDLRFTKGTARYTSNFTAPSAPFELNPVYIGADQSGNKNHFTPTNISMHDVMLDVPTKNYATLNPLQKAGTNGNDPSEGNLSLTGGSLPSKAFSSTVAATSGKYYAEFYLESSGYYPTVSVADVSMWVDVYGTGHAGRVAGNGVITYDIKATDGSGGNGQYYVNSTSATTTNVGITASAGDIIQVAFDADTRKVWFGRNNTWNGSGDPENGTNEIGTVNGTNALAVLLRSESGTTVVNFGQDPTFAGNKTSGQDTSQSEFYYAPPDDSDGNPFKSLNTGNLDAPTVTPSEHFDVLTYNGAYDNYMNYSGTSPQTITGTDFTPEIVWIKDRDNVSYDYGNGYHGGYWFDNVMGTGYALNTDLDNGSHYGSSLASGEDGISSFNSNGFTVDEADETNAAADSSGYGGSIDTYERYVAWCWKLGSSGSSSTWASGNTDPATEKYNASAGVSIIDYYDNEYSSSAITLNHSLGAAPEFAIAFDYEGYTSGHYVWHKDLSSGNYLTLDSSSSQSSDTDYFPASPATATTFTLGTSISSGTQSHVALFSGVEGYSKFGTYEGNGSTDGCFVYTGFRPEFLMVKRIGHSDSPWKIRDAARDPHNVATKNLDANSSGSEGDYASNSIDLLSNGFKWRTTGSHENHNGHDYIYVAFAESPFKHANAR